MITDDVIWRWIILEGEGKGVVDYQIRAVCFLLDMHQGKKDTGRKHGRTGSTV